MARRSGLLPIDSAGTATFLAKAPNSLVDLRTGANPRAAVTLLAMPDGAAATAFASDAGCLPALEDWREDRYEAAGLATFMEGSAWAEFEGFSNNLFLSAIEYMDMGDGAHELAYESGVLDL